MNTCPLYFSFKVATYSNAKRDTYVFFIKKKTFYIATFYFVKLIKIELEVLHDWQSQQKFPLKISVTVLWNGFQNHSKSFNYFCHKLHPISSSERNVVFCKFCKERAKQVLGKHYPFCYNTSRFLIFSENFLRNFLKKYFQKLKKHLWWFCENTFFFLLKLYRFYLIKRKFFLFLRVWETSQKYFQNLENWLVLQHKRCLLNLWPPATLNRTRPTVSVCHPRHITGVTE